MKKDVFIKNTGFNFQYNVYNVIVTRKYVRIVKSYFTLNVL